MVFLLQHVGFALISAYKQPLMLKDVVNVFHFMLKRCYWLIKDVQGCFSLMF